MKVLLKIGFYSILLPDDTGAATALKTLSRGKLVVDRMHAGVLGERVEPLELGMEYVPASIKLVKEPKK